MEKEKLYKLTKEFDIEGNPVNLEIIESGHINKTYKVEYDTHKKYILQYVNTNVFPNIIELMNNIEKVTKFMEQNGNTTTLHFINLKGKDKEYIYNNNWRMQYFIEDTTSYLSTESLDILEEAGKAIGDFQKELNEFDVAKLYETIKDFHNTPNRVKQLQTAMNSVENNTKRKNRFEKANEVVKFLTNQDRIAKTNIITNKLNKGEIPLRVTHNDTKLSNILFCNSTNKYKCLIDLDTLMPGSMVYDFGEGIRTGVTTSKEDEEDLSKIYVDMERFEAYTKGFLSQAKDVITKEELNLLPLGAWMMTYENAIRFLSDYLNGDIYFGVHKPDHNLIRTKSHIEILKQLEKNEEEMKGMIKQYGL